MNNHIYLKRDGEYIDFSSDYRFSYALILAIWEKFPRGYVNVQLLLMDRCGFHGKTLRIILDHFSKANSEDYKMLFANANDSYLFKVDWHNPDHTRPFCVMLQNLCHATSHYFVQLSDLKAAYQDFKNYYLL